MGEMNGFRIESFIVLDKGTVLREIRSEDARGEEIYSFANSGSLLYSLDTPLPIVVRGTGVIGLGSVKSFHVSATTTTVHFTMEEISQTSADVLYKYYRSIIASGVDVNQDNYDDVIIPGAMRSIRSKTNEDKPKSQSSSYYGRFNHYEDEY